MIALDETALSIRAKQAYELPDGLKLTVHREEDVDKILSEKCRKKLLTIGLMPFCPPEKMANQTVVVRTRSALIHDATEENLKEEILKQHPKLHITSIWKDSRLGIIKIQCQNTNEAKTLRSKDLKLKGFTMGPEDLETEEFIPISQCLRCYRLDSHTSSQCRDTRMYCGNCGVIDQHRHTDCTSTPDCINCIRDKKAPEDRIHNARSNTCPCKKKILKKKRRQNRDQSCNPEQRQPVEFVDAPPPSNNAWSKQTTTNARSISRGRGKQRGGHQNRKNSYGRRSHSRPQTHNQPPNTTSAAFPELARNGKERKQKQKSMNATQTIPMEHENSASARTHAGTVDGVRAPGDRFMEHSDLETALANAGMQPSTVPYTRESFTEARRIIEAEIPRPVTNLPTIAPATRNCNINEINIILTASHHHNLTRPGEFNKRANDLFKRAHLPAVDLGDEWHSADFLAAISEVRGSNSSCCCDCKCKSKGNATQETQESQPQAPRRPFPEVRRPQKSLRPPTVTLSDAEEVMDADAQGAKRRRETISPVEPDLKRNKDSSSKPACVPEPVARDYSSRDNLEGTITGTLVEQMNPEMNTLNEPREESPLTSTATDVFEDAETTLVSANNSGTSTPAGTDESQLGDDLPEVQQPAKEISVQKTPAKKKPENEMPPPKDLPVLNKNPQRSPRRRRSSSTDDRVLSPKRNRDPRLNRGEAPSPKGHTPLKRTSSTLALPKDLPPGPTFSQLDRALEEACEEDRRAKNLKRNSAIGKHSIQGTPTSTPRGLSKLEYVQNMIAADEISRNKLHITTSNKKLLDQIMDTSHPLSVPALIKLWKQEEIVIEVKPRTAAPDGIEPPWRVKKYATLTRTLYEDRIDPKEWEKYRSRLHISLHNPTLTSTAELATRKDAVRMSIMKNIVHIKDVKELNEFIKDCRSPEKPSRIRAPEPGDSQDFFDETPENSYKNIY